jgi:hypothetical protein
MARAPVDPIVMAHLRRTTAASGVPERLEDDAAAELVAALLTRKSAAPKDGAPTDDSLSTTPRKSRGSA